MLATVIVLCLTATVCLGSSGLGPCPTPKVIADFDLEKFAGTWYEIESSANVDKLSKKCSNYILEYKAKGKASVLHKYISTLSGKEKSEFSDITTPKSSEPGKLSVTPVKGTILARKYPLWIIDTDYDTYAITYSCKAKLVSHTEEVYILSKEKTLDDKKKMDLYDILKKADINQKNLVSADQESKECSKE